MTPPHLHALAAIESLTAALDQLADTARQEHRAIALEALQPADGLHSPTWGNTRHASGGHGDPTATAYLIGGVPFRSNRYQELLDDLTDQLAGLAQHLPAGSSDPLTRIRAAVPAMRPTTADATTAALVHLDQIARRRLRIGPDRKLLAGIGCPACGRRKLFVQTAGPVDAWTVVCAADSRHIWPRAAVLQPASAMSGAVWAAVIAGAVAGATPTTAPN